MSKYNPLWEYVRRKVEEKFALTFAEIESILGFGIDHSFLTYKKELELFGYRVVKISIKNKIVVFERKACVT